MRRTSLNSILNQMSWKGTKLALPHVSGRVDATHRAEPVP